MEGFEAVRVLARRTHEQARTHVGGGESAVKLLDGATKVTGIERQAVADDDPVLQGAEAILDSSLPAIFYKKGVTAEQANFYQAHEFGHHFLDSETSVCSETDIDVTMYEERIPVGAHRVEGYGPRERRECQANVFAREFLLPCSEARRLFSEERISATNIAKQFAIPIQFLVVPAVVAGTSGSRNRHLFYIVSQRIFP